VRSVLGALVRAARTAGVARKEDLRSKLRFCWAALDFDSCRLLETKLTGMVAALGAGRTGLSSKEWLGFHFQILLAIGLGRSILLIDKSVDPFRARFVPHCSMLPFPVGDKEFGRMMQRNHDWESLSYVGDGTDLTGVNVHAAVMKAGDSRILTVRLPAAW
jgi:hypothetical protein